MKYTWMASPKVHYKPGASPPVAKCPRLTRHHFEMDPWTEGITADQLKPPQCFILCVRIIFLNHELCVLDQGMK